MASTPATATSCAPTESTPPYAGRPASASLERFPLGRDCGVSAGVDLPCRPIPGVAVRAGLATGAVDRRNGHGTPSCQDAVGTAGRLAGSGSWKWLVRRADVRGQAGHAGLQSRPRAPSRACLIPALVGDRACVGHVRQAPFWGARMSPFIPEGVGPCQASSLGKFVDFLWVSRTGERHTPAPSGAESLCRGIPGLWVAVFASVLMRTVERSGIARSLFIPSPPTRVAWSVTAAARRGQSRQVDHATGGGGQNETRPRVLAAPGCD